MANEPITGCTESVTDDVILRLTEANAEAAELVAELEESKEQLEHSNASLAAANARSAELVAELHVRREELEWANLSLKEASEENKRLLGIAAHDIRSGIGAIAAMADLLCQVLEKSPQEGLSEAMLIRKESTHLLSFLESLIGDSKAELSQVKVRPSDVNLLEIVEDARNAQERLASRKDQTLHIETENAPAMAFADPIRTRQILDNLISNAIKFSPTGAAIHLKVRRRHPYLEVAVVDEGPGLSEEDFGKVFSQFAELSAKPTANEASHGIGLSIVRNLVELQGGRVWAENRNDRTGAAFCFTVPVPYEVRDGYHVLAVDDQASNRFVFKRLLEAAGHKVKTCRNGWEAVEAIRIEKFDLIFMDVEMPEMDGLEATRRIRSAGRDEAELPVIGVTGHQDPEHLAECAASGMNETIPKPIEKALLQRALAKWVLRPDAGRG